MKQYPPSINKVFHYNKQKAELIDNCILELRQTIKSKEFKEVLKQELAFLN